MKGQCVNCEKTAELQTITGSYKQEHIGICRLCYYTVASRNPMEETVINRLTNKILY